MGSALLFLSFVAALTRLGQATTAFELLSEEENEFQQRRLDFDDWCTKEIANQEKQRNELSDLHEDDQEEETEQFEVSEKLLDVARQLKPSPPELKVANVTMTALDALESDLAAHASGFFFRDTRGLQAVQKLLQEARDKMKGFSLAQTSDRTSLEAQLEVLKAEQRNSSDVLAARRAKALAARSGRQVLETALAQTEASLSEAAGLCGLGRTVLNRSASTGQMLARKALELIGMVEGSPDTPGPVISAPAVVPESKPQVAAGSDLLALSRQLQLQQQQVQQQLEEVKQMKAVATATSQPKAEIEAQGVEDPEPIKAPGRKRPKVAMSLAAEDVEATEASKTEGSEAKTSKTASAKAVQAMPAVPAVQASSQVPKAGAKSYDKLEADEESHRMQAPKDFPAALRGGWQALLAKKRAESFKKPAKVEEHSSIMDLMQTPKTYTAWQPDKASSPTADKAKQDLLAAEKAFDDDDDSEKNMKTKASFLQLDGDDSRGADLGGADPLAFFQVGSMTGIASPTFAAPQTAHSEVAMLLEKFADITNSSTLLELSKSQLQTKDFEMLLQKLEAAEDNDPSQQFCESVLQKDTSIEAKLKAELKKYYVQAKARHEAQALRREVVAREHLVSVFGNTSERFGAVHELLQHSFVREEGRLQRLEAQLVQLEATKSVHGAAQELRSVLGQLQTTIQHAQEELEDSLAGATSRQKQAEKLDQQHLQKLVDRVRSLEGSLTAGSSPQKIEKLCAIAAESRAKRLETHQLELEALRVAKALNELL